MNKKRTKKDKGFTSLNKGARTVIFILLWLILWELLTRAVGNKILIVGPLEVLAVLRVQMFTAQFWSSVGSSFLHIAMGYLIAFLAGIFAAAAAGRFSLLGEFLEPAVVFLQSVPVACFVILALIWVGSARLSVLITFFVVFPIIYRNVREGIRQTDRKLLEMAAVYRMRPWNKIWYIYRPQVLPYLEAGSQNAAGMAWKAGVAAEVIGVPSNSIGEKLYMAKIYLATAELFAWTLVILLLGYISGTVLWGLLHLAAGDWSREPLHLHKGLGADRAHRSAAWAAPETIRAENLCKCYSQKKVLWKLHLTLEPGSITCLMGASGCGKTTLLRILMGLEPYDDGSLTGLDGRRISAVFQENCLCEVWNSQRNLAMVRGDSGWVEDPGKLLDELIGKEASQKPTAALSGGMKRRVALARALAVPSDILLLDEPFTGLDEENRRRCIRMILKYRNERTLLIVTHSEEDARLLGARIIQMES